MQVAVLPIHLSHVLCRRCKDSRVQAFSLHPGAPRVHGHHSKSASLVRTFSAGSQRFTPRTNGDMKPGVALQEPSTRTLAAT